MHLQTAAAVVAMLLASMGPAARAESPAAGAECSALASIPIPAGDIGTAPSDCEAAELYFGPDGNGGNFAAARHCAYAQRAAHRGDEMFDGSATLMMLYANGRGVRRNIPLAKRFACELTDDDVTGERLQRLDAMAEQAPGKPFDVCDDVSSTFMLVNCADRDNRFAAFRRKRRIDAFSASWTVPQRRAYESLRKAADTYFAASSEGEVDQRGTGRDLFTMEAHEKLEAGLAAAIEATERHGAPSPSPQPFSSEDMKLNRAYQAWLRQLAAAAKDATIPGAVAAAGVRDAQRKWLAYREAWVVFGTSRFPGVPADTWRAWATHERTAVLKDRASDSQ